MKWLRLLIVLWVPVAVFAATDAQCTLLQKAGFQGVCNASTVVMPNDVRLGIAGGVNEAKAYLLSLADNTAGRVSRPEDPDNIYQLNNTFAVCAANFLKAYQNVFGQGSVVIVSAYRSPSVNAAAGGVSGSRHTVGLAMDVNPRGGGSYKTLYEFAKQNPSLGVCFPHYGWDNPHMTLASGANSGSSEAAKCAAQGVTQPCSGAPSFDSQAASYVGATDGAGTQSQPSYDIQPDSAQSRTQSAQTSPPAAQQQGASSGGSSGSSGGAAGQQTAANPYGTNSYGTTNPYGIWSDAGTQEGASTTVSAVLTCNPGNIAKGERVLITWQCGEGAASSMGGTSRRAAGFYTAGLLSGQGYASPSETTVYKLLCLDGSRVLGEDTCSVTVGTSAATTQDTRSLIHISADDTAVSWGGETTIIWATIGASSCQVKGGGKSATGTAGSLETGRLFHTTTYVLECETAKGTEAKSIEVSIL